MNERFGFAALAIFFVLLLTAGRAQAPELITFTPDEIHRFNDLQRDYEDFRRDVCWFHAVPPEECGQLTAAGVKRKAKSEK